MTINIIKVLLLVSVLVLPDYYLIESPFRIRTIVLASLLLIYLFDHLVKSNKSIQMSKNTRDVLLVAITLLIYVYISDVIKNDPIEAANVFYPNLLIPFMLLIFEYKQESFNLYKVLYATFGISIVFAVLQILGMRDNLSTLVTQIGFMKSDQMISIVSPQGLRVSGAAYSIVGFAEYLGILIIITYFRFIDKRNIAMLIGLAAMIIILFFTQTRSAIYGLVPSILVVHLLFERKNVRGIVQIFGFFAIILFVISIFANTIEEKFYRVTTPFDATVIERLQTNYYAVLGVWREAPLFGIPKEMAWEVISSTAAQEKRVFDRVLRITTTQHIQILYYFRYYGLIGVGLLIILYYTVFKKILDTTSAITKMTLLSIFIFDFQYSFGHNNRLINNILLWILLSLANNRQLNSSLDHNSNKTSN